MKLHKYHLIGNYKTKKVIKTKTILTVNGPSACGLKHAVGFDLNQRGLIDCEKCRKIAARFREVIK